MSFAAFVPTLTLAPSARGGATLSSRASLVILQPKPCVVPVRRAAVPAPAPVVAPLAHPSAGAAMPGAPAGAAARPLRAAVWLLSDLRVADNPALAAASADAAGPGGALVPLFAAAGRPPAALAAAAALRDELAARGSGLVVLRAAQDVASACASLRIDAVYFNRAVCAEDVRVQAAVESELRRRNVAVHAYWGNALSAPSDRDLETSDHANPKSLGLSELYERSTAGIHVDEPLQAPDKLPPLEPAAQRMNTVALQTKVGVSTASGMQVLESMSKNAERSPPARGGSPDLAFLLKEHLQTGVLSPKMVAAQVKSVVGAYSGVTFAELIWRDYTSIAAHRAIGVVKSGAAAVAST